MSPSPSQFTILKLKGSSVLVVVDWRLKGTIIDETLPTWRATTAATTAFDAGMEVNIVGRKDERVCVNLVGLSAASYTCMD